jgi:Do/DeqQ family serine protease
MLRILVALFVSLSAGPALAQAPAPRVVPQTRTDALLSYAPVVKRVIPAVVNVYASRVERQANNPLFDDPIFRQFFGGGNGGQGRTTQSLGSGVIVDPSGLIVTNNHVIEGMTDVKVALSDKREFDADIVLRDARTDLAVLKIKGGDGHFPVLEFDDSDALEVGDLVLAVGNPFGVGQTVTQGIVSALARTQVGISDYGFFIQTDAAINPGNSGGALVDMNARLVGINSAIYSRSGGSIGIGFAIPVNMLKAVVAAAKGGGRVKRPWIGASMQAVSRDIADSLGLDRPSGALVSDVRSEGPAAEAGIKRGDVITAVDGQPVDDPEGFGYRVGTKSLGGTASISVLRDGKKQTLSLKLVSAPETPPRETLTIAGRSPFTGVTVMNLSPAVAEELAIENAANGVVVSDVAEGSIAANFGVQKGDIVMAINDSKIASTKDLEKATASRKSYWKLTIGRSGQVFTTVIGG